MLPWHGPRQCCRSVEPLTPDLRKIECRRAPGHPSFHSKPALLSSRPTTFQSLWAKARHFAPRHCKKSGKHESLLLNLPPEMLLEIASNLPVVSLASLAITCKALYYIYRSPTLFTSLELPAEQPPYFGSARMSRPSYYQPVRQEFLSLLERDLKGEWQLCSECFILHPRSMFAQFKHSIAPWLRQYYTHHALDYRSCRHERKHLGARNSAAFAPVGIVDLCPCIKLTLGKKRYLETQLLQIAQIPPGGGNLPVAADFWWHQCQHTYHNGAVKFEMRIGIFVYDGTERMHWRKSDQTVFSNIASKPPQIGKLGVLIHYLYTYPSSLAPQKLKRSPRSLCPHLPLDYSIQFLLRCRKGHDRPDMLCTWCKHFQHCGYCGTKVWDLQEIENTNGAADTKTCRFWVERCLDDRLWSIQTVFPSWRRHVPLFQLSPLVEK